MWMKTTSKLLHQRFPNCLVTHTRLKVWKMFATQLITLSNILHNLSNGKDLTFVQTIQTITVIGNSNIKSEIIMKQNCFFYYVKKNALWGEKCSFKNWSYSRCYLLQGIGSRHWREFTVYQDLKLLILSSLLKVYQDIIFSQSYLSPSFSLNL